MLPIQGINMSAPLSSKSIISLTMCFMLLMVPLTVFSSNYEESFLEPESEKHFTLSSLNMPGFQTGSIYTDQSISVGSAYACAVLTNGDVSCWGNGNWGKLGYISTPGAGIDTSNRAYPTNVNSLHQNTGHFEEVSTSTASTCALNEIGNIYCWGWDGSGQLGNEDNDASAAGTPDAVSPVMVALPENTSALTVVSSATQHHKCAILNNSETICWGSNTRGQLGANWVCYTSSDNCTYMEYDWDDAGTSFPQVVQFPQNRSAIAIAAGGEFTCAITDNHAIYCWGKNQGFLLGQGDEITRTVPRLTELPGGREAVAIAAGGNSACAISIDHNVYCWGSGGNGVLGDGSNASNPTPGLVTLDEGDIPISITAGLGFYCIVLDTGVSKCWGGNWHGALGDGGVLDDFNNGIPRVLPTNVTGNHSFVAIESGQQNTCAIKSNGSAYCWGRPYDGATGDGSIGMTGQINYPVRVGLSTNPLFTDASERDHDDDGIVTIFDPNPYMCNSGYYQLNNECIEVYEGAYSIDGVVYLCDYGTYQPTTGQTSCIDSDPGHYVDTTNATEQLECLAGTHQPNSAQADCIDNSPGYYSLNGAEQQIGCPYGSYQPSPNSTSCISTDSGYFTNSVGSSSQTPCPAGSYQPLPSQNTCISADLGYFVSSSGSTNQEMCSIGNYTDSMGQVECILASQGYYVAGIGQDSQQACESGTYQTLQGQSDCSYASSGYYVPSNGSSQQIPCSEGSYQPTGGGTSCILAAPGSFVDSVGATEPSQCELGTYSSEEGQEDCTLAAPGSFVDSAGATEPIPCPSGQYQETDGSTSCVDSPPGYITSNDGSSAASPCQPGTYAEAGQSSCVDADPGNFVPDSAQSSQQLCDQGTYQPDAGQSSCLPSQPGNYVSKYGQTEQTSCETGTYQPGQNSLDCVPADPGNFVPTSGRSYQNDCEKGQYQPDSGQSECMMADPGSFVPSSGAERQFPCSPGTYQPASGKFNCEMASEDHFVSETGATEQTPCSSGDVQPNSGALRCIEGPKSFGDYLSILIIPLLIIGSALFYKYRNKGDNSTSTKKSRDGQWGEKTIDYVPKSIGRRKK